MNIEGVEGCAQLDRTFKCELLQPEISLFKFSCDHTTLCIAQNPHRTVQQQHRFTHFGLDQLWSVHQQCGGSVENEVAVLCGFPTSTVFQRSGFSPKLYWGIL